MRRHLAILTGAALALGLTVTGASAAVAAPPAAPAITSPAVGATLSHPQPTIVGTAVPDAVIAVTFDAGTAEESTESTTASLAGEWSLISEAALSNGAHTVQATATLGGETSPASAPVAFTVDSIAPARPLITSPANGSTVADARPVLTGTAEPNATLVVHIDGAAAGEAPIESTGAWTFVPAAALTNGPHMIQVTARDAAGNVSLPRVLSLTVDAPAPAAPVISTPAAGAVVPTGTPTIAGTAEADTTIAVTIDGVTAGTVRADGAGLWSFAPSAALAEGAHTVRATATNDSGSVSDPSDEVSFAILSTAPSDGDDDGQTAPIGSDPVAGAPATIAETGALARTGSTGALPLLWTGFALLLLGAGLTVAVRLRRATN
ncbi:hemagglutinin/hemolysin-like protein [Leifsonia xyli subsp. cynodontis DSM 46306]|uniref:Bacterial Ig-like domain-containing protein n=1 Tax=Leifsonia xyli subsp. cynodontis DSM 46306 TaxID=1389489 RepID=U3P6F0_LEIXC|nr:Ig-like domain-containing protein [Leifsonia xyli]AGW40492.1 hemagglutinin/hemolysin-like protein [Leifsonia xyli subsp. cynodontis DSM 46306]